MAPTALSADVVQNWQLVISALGFLGVIVTIAVNTAAVRLSARTLQLNVAAQNQKTDADHSQQWWARYEWAQALRRDPDPKEQALGWAHLDILSVSPLATHTEQDFIQLMALHRMTGDNGVQRPGRTRS